MRWWRPWVAFTAGGTDDREQSSASQNWHNEINARGYSGVWEVGF